MNQVVTDIFKAFALILERSENRNQQNEKEQVRKNLSMSGFLQDFLCT